MSTLFFLSFGLIVVLAGLQLAAWLVEDLRRHPQKLRLDRFSRR
jgi:hypothetical protein